MRKKIALAVATMALALTGVAATATPASAGPPVKAGKDSCGNFNVWINGSQVIYYLHCGPDPY